MEAVRVDVLFLPYCLAGHASLPFAFLCDAVGHSSEGLSTGLGDAVPSVSRFPPWALSLWIN